MLYYAFSSEQTIQVLSDGAQRALNLHATTFFFLQVVVWWWVCTFFTKLFISGYFVSSGKAYTMYLSINSTASLSSFSSIFEVSTIWIRACICSVLPFLLSWVIKIQNLTNRIGCIPLKITLPIIAWIHNQFALLQQLDFFSNNLPLCSNSLHLLVYQLVFVHIGKQQPELFQSSGIQQQNKSRRKCILQTA